MIIFQIRQTTKWSIWPLYKFFDSPMELFDLQSSQGMIKGNFDNIRYQETYI